MNFEKCNGLSVHMHNEFHQIDESVFGEQHCHRIKSLSFQFKNFPFTIHKIELNKFLHAISFPMITADTKKKFEIYIGMLCFANTILMNHRK